MQRGAVLIVTAKLDEGLAERVELLQRVKRGLLRAQILNGGEILGRATNAGDEMRVSDERDKREDNPERSQSGGGGEQDSPSQVTASACAAGSQRGAVLQQNMAENVTEE